MRAAFRERYGRDAAVVVRAPGRVNLIGEHTDYSGLPVLPIAIERATWIAAAPLEQPRLEAFSTGEREAVALTRSEPRAHGGWGRYLAGALQEFTPAAPGCGVSLFVDSDLPASGGLSSSSALTLGVLSAINACWDGGLTPEDLVARAAVAERHVGVETGGMDQTVIAFATEGHALRIDFQPPSHRAIALPAGLAFVVANSGEAAPKGGAARDAYNERVIGARLAAALLTDQVGLDIPLRPALGDLVDLDVVDVLADDLPDKISPQEVAHGVDANVENLVALTAGRYDPRLKVRVKGTARHILAEAARVNEAEVALLAGELAAFGALLNASHDSLRNDLRCSTPALDKVCAAMRKAGAYGARLTGAGFGGFALAAVPPERVAAVIAAAEAATGGPAFEVHASGGLSLL